MVTLVVSSGYDTLVTTAVGMAQFMDMPLNVRAPTTQDVDTFMRRSIIPPVLIMKCTYVMVRTDDDVKRAFILYK
jgi:hypothetical protein